MLSSITKENLTNIKIKKFKLELEGIKGNFIPTEEAKERLQKIKNFFDSRIPVLLEGPTGTSKTKTIQVLCDILKKNLIRFNLSSETTIEDLIGRLGSGGEDSWSNFKFIPGPFYNAFKNGDVLLLDEVNLGQKSVLQCMETALDTGEIKQDIPGCGTIKEKMHENFIIVATQNPKIDGFSNQRDELSQKFISRFTVVEFPSFEIEELRNIAKGIAEKNKYKKSEIVKQISDLHYKWVYKEKDSKTSSQCFTVRDINATIKAISEGQEACDAVNCFYGSRYREKEFMHLMDIIKKEFTLLYKDLNTIPELPKDFPKCYSNFSLKKVFYFANIAKKNGRHLLIVGKEGSGITQVSKWLSWYFTPEEKRKEIFLFIFSPETTVSDMIGKFTPKADIENSSTGIFEWRNGPLTQAVKYGYSGIFDNISSAPAKVIESLNALLDPKILKKIIILKYLKIH
jgi:midasin (ATPase involved in ribosome maturation)